MLPDWTVIGFTGHRSLANAPATAEAIGVGVDQLLATQGAIFAISSLAKGADAMFVREIVRRKIPLLLILPFPVERFKKDFSPEEWSDVAPLLEHAVHVEEVTDSASDDEAYMETGVRIVDRSDVLIAVWDGQPTVGLGGTADVVAYARALDVPVSWINAATGRAVSERFDRLPARAASAGWGGDPRQTVEQHFRELDETASLRAPKVRHLIQRVVLLHLIASVTGLTALALEFHGVAGYTVAVFEVLVLGTAFALTAMRHHSHKEWMRSRIEAEVCRSFLATWAMRARLDRLPTLAIQGFERLTRNLRLLQRLDRSPAVPLDEARRRYLEGRVAHQIDYFSRRSDQSRRTYGILTRLAMASTALAALMAAGHLLLPMLHVEGPVITGTMLLSLVLPLVSAALLSLALTQEHSRRAARYREMVADLEEAARELGAVRTWNGLTRIAMATEEALLNEAVEWHSFRRFASEPH